MSAPSALPPPLLPPAPPERKMISPKPVAVPSPVNKNATNTLRSSSKPVSPSKKLSHARSTPDLSSLVSDNDEFKHNPDDDTSSSIENLSNTYSISPAPQKSHKQQQQQQQHPLRPSGSILKRRSQPPAAQPRAHEEPIYTSSASVPLQRPGVRSVQSMIRDQKTTHTSER